MSEIYVKCPGCGQRYRFEDYTKDKLVCPACGREIPVLISVREADEVAVIRKYFRDEILKNEVISQLITMPLFVGAGIAALFYFDLAWYWQWGGAAFSIVILYTMLKEARLHLKIWRMLKAARYRLHPFAEAFERWREGLTEEAREDLPEYYQKDFIGALRELLTSKATLQEKHQRLSEVTGAEAQTAQTAGAGKVQTYDVPPEKCPYCHEVYEVADFATSEVFCRRCGRHINIRCVIEEEEIQALVRKYLAATRRTLWFLTIVFSLVTAALIYLTARLFPTEFVLRAYLFSYDILPLFGACAFGALTVNLVFQFRALAKMLRRKFVLAELEYRIKVKGAALNDASFVTFKAELIELYRRKKQVIKGGTRS